VKKAIQITILIIALALLIPFAWGVIARYSVDSSGQKVYRYTREMEIATRAIENSGCAKIGSAGPMASIPEEIEFHLSFESGQRLIIFFDVRGKEVNQMIDEPAGLTVGFASNAGTGLLDQTYSVETLAMLLKGKNFEVKNLKDILCHVEELKTILKANQENQKIPREPLGNVKDYWHLLFMER
jgi:hypothetical protein